MRQARSFIRQLALTAFAFIASGQFASAENIEYSKLGTTRLPYGEGITISGSLADFVVADPAGGDSLTVGEWLDVSSINLTVTVAGTDSRPAVAATIQAGNWLASVDKLPQNSSVTFTFAIGGALKTEKAQAAVESLFQDENLWQATDDFATATIGKPADVVITEIETFLERVQPIAKGVLPGAFQTPDDTEIGELLRGSMEALINVPRELENVWENCSPEDRADTASVKEASTLSAAYAALSEIENSAALKTALGIQDGTSCVDELDDLLEQVQSFVTSFERAKSVVPQNLVASVSFESAATKFSTVSDFEKYAGLDVGGIYVPRTQSLRSFFTVNVYLGAVEDTPAPAAGTGKKKFATWFRQRFSLTGGVSVGDLSNQTDTIIKDNNAFLFGAGLRINKYFRITAGDMLFRKSTDDKIGHAFFIGPSIDVTALGNIVNVFGKLK
jgi:hypothetical protein